MSPNVVSISEKSNDSDNEDEEDSMERIADEYKALCTKLDNENLALKREKSRLMKGEVVVEKYALIAQFEKANMEVEADLKETKSKVAFVEKKLAYANVVLKKLGTRSDKLDEILIVGRVESGHSGLGFMEKENEPSISITFVKVSEVVEESPSEIKGMKPDVKPKVKSCHHFGKAGHIKTYCFKLRNELKGRFAKSVPALVAAKPIAN